MYWSLGQNLVDMINKAERESRWDVAGVGYFMKAWGWQVLTDMHGEIIVKQAIDPTRALFDYDTQEFTYTEIQRLLGLAIADQKTMVSMPRTSERRITSTSAIERGGSSLPTASRR